MQKQLKQYIQKAKTLFKENRRVRLGVLGALGLVVIGGGVLLAASGLRFNATERGDLDVNTVAPPAAPKTKAEPLTGVEVAAALADRHVTGVMVENSPNARPHSGLQDAGVVFEAVTEGGITRFLALYQANKAEMIGPVRSLRVPFLDWIAGYDAAIAHVGGSAEALQLVQSRGLKTMTQFTFANAYWRSGDRPAPHNVYTSIDRLDQVAKVQGFTTSKFESYKRKEDAPLETPTATTIRVNFSSTNYNVVYTYNATNNDYQRAMGGAPHIDRERGQAIRTKNVVIIHMPTSYSGQYAIMQTVGSGKATIFRDGGYIDGTWKKDSRAGQLQLLAADGTEISLNRGNTWFSVVPEGNSVTF